MELRGKAKRKIYDIKVTSLEDSLNEGFVASSNRQHGEIQNTMEAKLKKTSTVNSVQRQQTRKLVAEIKDLEEALKRQNSRDLYGDKKEIAKTGEINQSLNMDLYNFKKKQDKHRLKPLQQSKQQQQSKHPKISKRKNNRPEVIEDDDYDEGGFTPRWWANTETNIPKIPTITQSAALVTASCTADELDS